MCSNCNASRLDQTYSSTTMMVNQSFVTFLLLLPVVSIAFGNLPPKLSDLFASNFVQNLRSISKDETARRTVTVDPGVALLQELGITRTTPKPFQIRPDQIPDVLSSALPVRRVSISCAHPFTGGGMFYFSLPALGCLSFGFWCLCQWLWNILNNTKTIGVHNSRVW